MDAPLNCSQVEVQTDSPRRRSHEMNVSNSIEASLHPLGYEALAGHNNIAAERKQPLTRPAPAGENAVAGHPLPKG